MRNGRQTSNMSPRFILLTAIVGLLVACCHGSGSDSDEVKFKSAALRKTQSDYGQNDQQWKSGKSSEEQMLLSTEGQPIEKSRSHSKRLGLGFANQFKFGPANLGGGIKLQLSRESQSSSSESNELRSSLKIHHETDPKLAGNAQQKATYMQPRAHRQYAAYDDAHHHDSAARNGIYREH